MRRLAPRLGHEFGHGRRLYRRRRAAARTYEAQNEITLAHRLAEPGSLMAPSPLDPWDSLDELDQVRVDRWPRPGLDPHRGLVELPP